MITNLLIQNFRRFEQLSVVFDPTVNILVGNNDSGKSTIVQALEMVLTGRIGGRPVDTELSPYWFPLTTTQTYTAAIKKNPKAKLPEIVVEAYFLDNDELAQHRGKNNILATDAPGIRLSIEFDASFIQEYEAFIADATRIRSIPIEFYRVSRRDFAGQTIGQRPPVSAAIIDASTLRVQSGSDHFLRQTIEKYLPIEARAKLSVAFRTHREQLAQDDAFVAANASIATTESTLSKKQISLSTDSSSRTSWIAGVVPHLDQVPFHLAGQGEQSAFKILMALRTKGVDRQVVVVEEPENHLSHARLNELVERIKKRSEAQQLIITTHSSFVLNKLGIDNLKLVGESRVMQFQGLEAETRDYFLKLAGHDTLRLVLARAVILVEGPSDELIVQKAFHQKHNRLPIESGVDVISVQSLAFKRFLSISRLIGRKTAVLTDLDSDTDESIARSRFKEFESPTIQGFIGRLSDGETLEPQLISSIGRESLNVVLGCNFATDSELRAFMAKNKTDCALAILQSSIELKFPSYIEAAIEFVK